MVVTVIASSALSHFATSTSWIVDEILKALPLIDQDATENVYRRRTDLARRTLA